jgi:hypothetical protein
VKTNLQAVLTIDGTKVRHERVGPVWDDLLGAAVHANVVEAFDGKIGKTLSEATSKQGWISAQEMHQNANNIHLVPVLRHYRHLSPAFGLCDPDCLRIVSTDESLRGVACILLEEVRPNWSRKYWVAPEQEMSIVRYVSMQRGQVTAESDVSFRKHALHGWLPVHWNASVYVNGGKKVSSCTTTVAAFEINLDVPESKFDIAFPTGTEVYDRINKRTYVVE